MQNFMEGHSCYTTRDNAEVALFHAVGIVPVSTQTHQLFIRKYCDLHSWWKAVVCYLIDQVKSDQVLKKLATLEFCYVNSWMTFDKTITAEVY